RNTGGDPILDTVVDFCDGRAGHFETAMSTVAIPHSLTGLLDKPVAVLGAGVSGRAVEALLACCGCGSVLYDEGGKGNHLEFGETDARAHRLAVFSPGFAPDHPWLKAAQVAGCRVMGELEFASRFWKGK